MAAPWKKPAPKQARAAQTQVEFNLTTILTNAELEKRVETTDQWIRERTGIEQRHIAAEGEYTSDLAVAAAEKALAAAGSEVVRLTVNTEEAAAAIPHIRDRLAALGVQPTGAADDSRQVQPGDLFIAYPGDLADGRRYIADAIARGAVAVL